MMSKGTYVVGMEPGNSLVMGGDKERGWGTLQYLSPQETKEFHLELGVLVGDEVKEFKERVYRITSGKRPRMVMKIEEFIRECVL